MSVVAVQPFRHLGRLVTVGQWVEMEPIEAAVKSREGLVSLSHGRNYQTRDMVAEPSVQPVMVEAPPAPAGVSDLEPVPIDCTPGQIDEADSDDEAEEDAEGVDAVGAPCTPSRRRRRRSRKAL